VLALAGCGSSGGADSAGDFDGAEQDVAEVIEDLEEAGQDEDARRICNALLAKSLVEEIESRGEDCEKAIDKALAQTDAFDLTVKSVRVTGTTARARVETGVDEKQEEVVELAREGGAWKIAGLPGA
jgi:hypothetical protein